MDAVDEQHNQAFGENTGILKFNTINLIKNNDPNTTAFTLGSDDAGEFSNLAWKLLGRYIANNNHLSRLDLDESRLTDEKMTLLFGELVSSRSLDRLDLDGNSFGIDGVRCMAPFLQNSPNLSALWLGANNNFNAECFEVLVSALDGKSVTDLHFYNCNITDIAALDRYSLPNLQQLNLNGNKIGGEGCIAISNLLQKEGSTLATLRLRDMNMGDYGAKIIAASLKHNTTLKQLHLSGNNLTNETYVVFLKLLVDISSIDSVYLSNHALKQWELNEHNGDNAPHAEALNDACKENRLSSNPEAVGRAKVIKYQLDSQKRKKLCHLQGIEYSIGNLLVDIDPNLLPQTLVLIGREHGHSEFYTSLLPVAPDLLSFINREAILEKEKAKNTAQIAELTRQLAALSSKNDQIDKRLELIKLGSKQMAVVDEGKAAERSGNEQTSCQCRRVRFR